MDAKETIMKGMDMTLAQGLKIEADLSILLQSTLDRKEGLQSFIEKRLPRFTGAWAINMDAFESIELTATDMIVTQRGAPYPNMVPSFPIITTDNRLDYGSIIE